MRGHDDGQKEYYVMCKCYLHWETKVFLQSWHQRIGSNQDFLPIPFHCAPKMAPII